MRLTFSIKQSAVRPDPTRLVTSFPQSKTWKKLAASSLQQLLIITMLIGFLNQQSQAQTDSTTYYKIENQIDSCFNLQSTDRDAALQMAKKASLLAKEIQSWHQLAVALECQGIIYFYLGTFDTASTYLNQAKMYYLKSKSFKGLASIYNNLGLLEQGKGNFPKAKILFKQALNADTHANDVIGKSYTINNLGTVYYHQGIGDTANLYFEQARQIAIGVNDTAGIINYHSNLGLLLKDQGNFKEAIRHFTKAESLCQAIGDKSGELICQFNRGDIYVEQGEFTAAKAIYTNCLQELEILNDAELRTHCLLAIGTVLQKESKLKESNDWYQKALKETEQYKNNQLICNILTKMGVNFAQDLDFRKAQSYYRLSLQIAQRNGLLLEISENYKQMAIAAAKFLSNDSASIYIEKYAASRYYGNTELTYNTLEDSTSHSNTSPKGLKHFTSFNLAIKLILILAFLFTGLAIAPILIRSLAKKKDGSTANSHNNGQ